jgi:flagellar hook-length control protein FliK
VQPASDEKHRETDEKLKVVSPPAPLGREPLEIKAAEKGPAAPVPSQASEVIQQILHQLNARVTSGPGTMRLQLNPRDLGAIEVQMVSSPQGVKVTFFAEQASTGRLLEADLNQLRQTLTEAGVQFTGLSLGQHSQPRQAGGFLQENPPFAQAPPHEVFPDGSAARKEPLAAPVSAPVGEVDYRI